MTDRTGMCDGSSDPLIIQAEKILSQRMARNLVIDPDLLGEPGWDILLIVFIETGHGRTCRADLVSKEIGLSSALTMRWAGLLAARDMLMVDGSALALTPKAESILRQMFSAQMQEVIREMARRAS